MDVNEVKNLLKQILEDYEIQHASAENHIKEHEKDWKEQFSYAEFLSEPVRERQILFWNGQASFMEGRTKNLFEYLYKYYGHRYSYIWVVKYNRDKPKEPAAGITFVKKNSEEYWKALAQSGYLIGEGALPAAFVKRKGQFYVNFSQQSENTGIDSWSLIKKEYRKADFICQAGQDAAFLAEQILKRQREEPERSDKRKILFLTNWKEEREHRLYLQKLLSLADTEKYELTVMTPRMGNISLENEFEMLGDSIKKYVYRGRMTTTREECRLMYMLEKNPVLYQREPIIHEFIDELIKREWKRIWGVSDFDVVVLAGNPGVSRYFLACGSGVKRVILLDLGFLEKLQKKYPDDIEDICSVFECIYTFPDENTQMKRKYLPWIQDNVLSDQNEPQITTLGKKEYLICDRWLCDVNRTGIRLVEYPLKGSSLVNTDLYPDPKRETLLKEKLKDRKVYLIGKESKTYAEFLPGSTILDRYIVRYLPGLPAARWFFGQLQDYYSDERLEYDRLAEICMVYNVKTER